MKPLKWLYPGLRIKRWLFLAFIGFILVGGGLIAVLQGQLLVLVIGFLSDLSNRWLGDVSLRVVGIWVLLLGLILLVAGLQRMVRSILSWLVPRNETGLLEVIHQRRQLKKGPKIVVLGGGTGLSVMLRGLKEYTSNLTAIVTVSDDGGSSGRLRGQLGILPPGDTRNVLVALADRESLMEQVLSYRFRQGEGLVGHNLGNLLLAALTDLTGDFHNAIEELSKVLAIRGRVLPSTLSDVVLVAKMVDGTVVKGETQIAASSQPIKQVYLEPADCRPLREALEAIDEADAIVLGPGSLYTSIIPNLLVAGIPQALAEAKAPVFYVCNVMTQPGETDRFSASDHLRAIWDHAGDVVDFVVVNAGPIPQALLEKYKRDGSYPVQVDDKTLHKMGVQVVQEQMIDNSDLVRHDPYKLARVIIQQIFAQKTIAERLSMLDFYLNERLRDLVG